jgi:hypothetical protein
LTRFFFLLDFDVPGFADAAGFAAGVAGAAGVCGDADTAEIARRLTSVIAPRTADTQVDRRPL